jgi:serine/threonine protein phosphatase PrpC
VFAVFDGHGGREVAKYTAKYLEDIIKTNTAYKSGEVCEGLRQSFLEIDVKLEAEDG